MPMYLYRCQVCGAQEEHIQKFSDPPMTDCEACGGELEKVLTPAAFHLKGGGWYKDLYASSKSDGAAASDAGSGSDAAASTTTKETKGTKGSDGAKSGGSSSSDKSSGSKGKSSGSGSKAAAS